MMHFGKFKEPSLRLMLFVGLVIVSVIPFRSWAFAQRGSAPVWVVRSLQTSEFGISEPKGLAFSSAANTFLVLDGSGNIVFVTMGEEETGTRAVSEVQNDPLNVAFDDHTSSLFVFNRGRSELVKIKSDGKGLLDASAPPTRFASKVFSVRDPQGIAFDSATGRLFILDAGNTQIVSMAPHPTLGFDANKIQRISLRTLGTGTFRGIAYNPGNGHLYVSEPVQKRLYELTQSGDLVSTFDLAALGINNPSAMTFAPSVDNTDDPNIYDLFILDSARAEQTARPGLAARSAPTGQAAASNGSIVELSFRVPAALPSGTNLLPATLVHIIDTSKAAWSPSSPDPSGLDYWPARQSLLISDSEVEEMPIYFVGKNVFESTTSGRLVSTCSTTSFSNEPTGVAINPNNNHIFVSDDTGTHDKVFEVSMGSDGIYCTADDTVTITDVATLYNATDAEDVAYGNNSLFIAGGVDAEVYRIPLGADGILGGGDDGPRTHFDTAILGFQDLEGIDYNEDAGTLFIVSTKSTDTYLGETTITGTLLRAYDLSLMGNASNIRSDVTYAPGSQNPAIKHIYIASRGIDNDNNRNENDGRVWEISIGTPVTATPSRTRTPTATPTVTPTPTPFTTPPGKASLISPSGSIDSRTPTYTWNKVLGATWYYLWINDPTGNVFKQWYEVSAVCGASTCSATPAITLNNGTSYTWWIQTWNSYGYGPWSDGLSFSVQTIPPPGMATLVSPSGNIPDTTPTYIWNKVNAATWYYLWVSMVNNDGSLTTMHSKWYESSAVCGSTLCSFTPSVTLTSGNYRWWIRTWNAGGYGPWSAAMNFSITP